MHDLKFHDLVAAVVTDLCKRELGTEVSTRHVHLEREGGRTGLEILPHSGERQSAAPLSNRRRSGGISFIQLSKGFANEILASAPRLMPAFPHIAGASELVVQMGPDEAIGADFLKSLDQLGFRAPRLDWRHDADCEINAAFVAFSYIRMA